MIHWKSDLIANFDTVGERTGDAAPSPAAVAIPFNAGGGLGAFAGGLDAFKHPELTTLDSFNVSDGAGPQSLIADASGDLFGVTAGGGANGHGTVFEIAKTKHGYASAPTTLVSFTGANGSEPLAGVSFDAAGDIFGTTHNGGAAGDGTVFEIVKTQDGYAGAPTTLVNFTGADGQNSAGSLIADTAGDLFGTTSGGGANGDGTVFEVAKTQDGYASAPTTLYSFTGADGAGPESGLIADAAGDLFGTTSSGGPDGNGTVFEIAKTNNGYAGAPTTLASFSSTPGPDQGGPDGNLVFDAAGDIFGEVFGGGASGSGFVFEIAKISGGYAGATILASFGGKNGSGPSGSLVIDAAGNLFGATYGGGANGDGTVFEIAKTQGGYASKPTILVSLTGSDGTNPFGGIIADAAGDLLGTTSLKGGQHGGTVFKITNSGYVTQQPAIAAAGTAAHDAASGSHSSPLVAVFVQAMAVTKYGGEVEGLMNARTSQGSHPLMLAAPRLVMA